MRLAFVLGTRPEIIKTAPLVFEARRLGVETTVIHSGQHYDHEMDGAFFMDLGLSAPDVQLKAGGLAYAAQLGYLTREIGTVLARMRPDAVVVQGDTVTVMAGALAADRLGIPVVHHEAGLRSRDPRMAEEYHRVITDHLSTLLCAPTDEAEKNLREEGIDPARIRLTGNTIVDAVHAFAGAARERSDVLERLDLKPGEYFALTLHRAENVDERTRLVAAIEALSRVVHEHPDRALIVPAHPRTQRRLAEHGLAWPEGVHAITPLGYLDMIRLIEHADLVLTDSGGLQEESAILGTPCVTLRDSTERPETVAAGVNLVSGLDHARVAEAVQRMRGKRHAGLDVYGDGRAAERILAAILEHASVQSAQPA